MSRFIGAMVAVLGFIMMMYIIFVVLGGVFDELAFASSLITVPGHTEWVTKAVSRFSLIYTGGIGLCIAMIIWGILTAVREAEYSREMY